MVVCWYLLAYVNNWGWCVNTWWRLVSMWWWCVCIWWIDDGKLTFDAVKSTFDDNGVLTFYDGMPSPLSCQWLIAEFQQVDTLAFGHKLFVWISWSRLLSQVPTRGSQNIEISVLCINYGVGKIGNTKSQEIDFAVIIFLLKAVHPSPCIVLPEAFSVVNL